MLYCGYLKEGTVMKYKILHNNILQKDDIKLYRIQALKSFLDVKEGDIGGFVQCENNLSQFGNCWVYDDAQVSGYAVVYNDAIVKGCARVMGYSKVLWKSVVQDYSLVQGHSLVTGYAHVTAHSVICGCFTGSLNEFKSRVHETHYGTVYEKEYNALIDLIKIHFNI